MENNFMAKLIVLAIDSVEIQRQWVTLLQDNGIWS